MSIALRQPLMSREAFFDWAEAQEAPYEFDGFQPVAMTGGTIRHNLIIKNIIRALDTRLQGECWSLGPQAGVRTIGDAVRYPDALTADDSLPLPEVGIDVPVAAFFVGTGLEHNPAGTAP